MVVLKSIIAGSLLLLLGMGLGASLVLAWLSRRTVDGPPPTGKPVEASTLPASRRCSFETSEASHGKWVPAKFGVDSSPVRGRSNNVPAWTRKCMELWRSPGSDLPPRPFSDMPYWEWEPDACKLDRFHQGKFCSAMAHRKGLLIVGDSLSRLMAATLAAALGAVSSDPSPGRPEPEFHGPPPAPMELYWKACGGSLRLTYIRNDLLDPRDTEFYGPNRILCKPPRAPKGGTGALPADVVRTTEYCRVFTDTPTLLAHDVVIANSGIHYRPLPEYRQAMVVAAEVVSSAFRRASAKIQINGKSPVRGSTGGGDRGEEGGAPGEEAGTGADRGGAAARKGGEPETVLIFRNTVPGHNNCTASMFSQPLTSLEAMELLEQPGSDAERYHWDQVAEMNAAVEPVFRGAGWSILDVHTPTLLRADNHRGNGDCLHYCVPGPIDHWVVLAFNMLLDLGHGALAQETHRM